ncbi:hypothetical protein, partial [Enterococcus sp. DIV1271a]|uniref:hypothetical protein n=1 Tax=Enterococcus sp. DIV1271a TaxID=2815327 RepID=UPI001A9B04B5
MSFSIGAISVVHYKKWRKRLARAGINFWGISCFLGKARNKLMLAWYRDTFQCQYSIEKFIEIVFFSIILNYL